MPQKLKDQVLYSKEEAAKKLGISLRTLDRWMSNNHPGNAPRLEHIKNPYNGRVYFREEVIVSVLDSILDGAQ